MAARDIIVVGASAGGVEALCEMVGGLPAGLPAAVFVVCHVPTSAPSNLPDILSRRGKLLARHPRGSEPVYPGQVYVAPPDYHLVLEDSSVRLDHGPRENRFRPSIDPLFRSAAREYGPRVVAVLLSGGLSDGVAGLLAVRAAGGRVVIQDPADAIMPALPERASEIVGADHVVPARELAPLLLGLIREGAQKTPPGHNPGPHPTAGGSLMSDPVDSISRIVDRDFTAQSQDTRRGSVSMFTCPECGGCMWQLDEMGLLRFRCHVGHAYAADDLLDEQSSALEAALWTAVRTFKEKTLLSRQLANRQREAGKAEAAARFDEEAQLAERYGKLIEQYLLSVPSAPPAAAGAEAPGGGGEVPSPKP